jgi:hypothetical protein
MERLGASCMACKSFEMCGVAMLTTCMPWNYCSFGTGSNPSFDSGPSELVWFSSQAGARAQAAKRWNEAEDFKERRITCRRIIIGMKNGERSDFSSSGPCDAGGNGTRSLIWSSVKSSQHEPCRQGTIHDLRDPPYGSVELLPISLVLPTLHY